jgi:processive 1,2-diacylglycerol beta-glucosyltransferase
VNKKALILSGSIGLGHEMIAKAVLENLSNSGWTAQVVDCMALLGPLAGRLGEWSFRVLTSSGGAYDALHFAHLRTNSGLATAMDSMATSRLVPVIEERISRDPVGMVIGVFATGASVAAQLRDPQLKRIALCTDALVHSLWVKEGIDLYLVTSKAAVASVHRYQPNARVALVPSPVRSRFFAAPSRQAARDRLGVPANARCVLVMGGGWGLGPLEQTAAKLAEAGIQVLVVAGRNASLERRLRALSRRDPRVRAYGFVEDIEVMMAACDLVVTTPGATTCSEARAMDRHLMLLDTVPGHGRENVQHELELGGADACDPVPERVVDCTLATLARLEQVDLDGAGSSLPGGQILASYSEFGDSLRKSLEELGIAFDD